LGGTKKSREIEKGENKVINKSWTMPQVEPKTNANIIPVNTHLTRNYYQNFFINLKSNRSQFCDVELVAGGGEQTEVIKAHRIVLSSSSSYFAAMFGNSEFNENKEKIVKLVSINSRILRTLVDFIYTGVLEIDQINVQELLAAADMLQLHDVVSGCAQFLCRELHPSNALGILRFAEAHNCKELAESAIGFINCHFPEVSEHEEILEVSQQMMTRLISSELIRVDSEFQVFLVALRWINHEVSIRKRFVFEILGNVRLSLVPVKIIEAEIAKCRDPSLKIALRSILKDVISRRGTLVPVGAHPRIGAKKSIYIIGGSKRESASGWTNDCIFDSVITFNIFRNEWSDVASMEVGRILPGVGTLSNKIYVVGGERGSQIFANGEVYDPISNTWEKLPAMNTPRCEFGLCALGGTLWAVGGWIGEDIGDSIESFCPIRNTWETVGKLPEPRFSMGMVSFEGLIYIVGGCTQASRHLPDLISYNPVTQEFTYLSKMQVC
jgi:actin-binding protein IPP